MGPIYEKQTPTLEVIDDFKSHLEKIEQWEADWLMTEELWRDGINPKLNKSLFDRWLELQKERKQLLKRFQ